MARSFRNYDNEHESTEHAMRNNIQVSSSTITHGDLCNKYHKPAKQFVSTSEYDQSIEIYGDANDFVFSYLDNQVSLPSIIGVNPNETFKDVLSNKNIQLSVDNDLSNYTDFRDNTHLNSAEKTGPKVNENLV